MSFMKNKLSYALWSCFAVLTVFAYIGFMILAIQKMAISDNSIVICFAVLPVVLGAGVFLLARWCVNKYHDNPLYWLEEKAEIFKSILLVLLLGMGIYFRYDSISIAGESAAYFEAAKVGATIPATAHATQAAYVYLLRGLFYLLGNKFMVAVIAQIAMQVIAAFIWHYALRKLLGNVAAFLFFGAIMGAPYFVKESLTLSPNVLFFLLYGFALYLIGVYYKHLRHTGSITWADNLWSFIIGGIVSIIAFFDAIGLSLFAVLFFVRHLRNKKEDNTYNEEVSKNIAMQFGLHILGYFVFYIVLTYLDALFSKSNVQIIMSVGIEIFQPKTEFNPILLVNGFSVETMVLCVAAVTVLLIGLPAFWMRRDRENQLVWFALFVVVMIYYGTGMNANAMPYEFMAVVSALLMICAGIQGILIVPDEAIGDLYVPAPKVEKVKRVKTKKTKQFKEQKPSSNVAKVEPAGIVTDKTKEENYYKPQENVNYIENPLPLPKKPQRKTMGYKIEVPESQMYYEISVREDDDYDI